MVEHTQPAGHRAIEIRRAASPGQFVSYAGSDIARGEALLRAGTVIGSREIGMLAACGLAYVTVARRPRVAIISTGDELVQPGQPLRPAAIYDTNGAIVTAAITENGGEAAFLGAIPDDEARLEAAMRDALKASDMLVLSGGTSKGAGDVSHRIIGRLGKPGIIAHGVALKPGKPLCLAVCDGKPVIILPGFPTSAMFTFHDMIVPVLRRMAGQLQLQPGLNHLRLQATVNASTTAETAPKNAFITHAPPDEFSQNQYPSGLQEHGLCLHVLPVALLPFSDPLNRLVEPSLTSLVRLRLDNPLDVLAFMAGRKRLKNGPRLGVFLQRLVQVRWHLDRLRRLARSARHVHA
jgi:molybdenum cofactor synthesis domain-containing protein